MDLLQKIKEMIVAELPVKIEDITPESRLVEDLGADSIDAVQLVMEIESEFGVTIPDEELAALKTVGDLVGCIQKNK